MDLRNMSVSSMFPSVSLFFDINKIMEDRTGSIQPEPQRLVWLKDKPRHIDVLDKFIRSKFEIPLSSKMVFSLYLPPTGKDKSLFIKKSQHKLISRVFISTLIDKTIAITN